MGEEQVGHGVLLTRFLENEWAAMHTTRGAWCRSAGLAGSTVLRWSQGVEPDLRNLQTVADGLSRKLVDVLFAAGYIDESQLRARTVAPPRERIDIETVIKTDPSLSGPERDALLAVHTAFQAALSDKATTRRRALRVSTR